MVIGSSPGPENTVATQTPLICTAPAAAQPPDTNMTLGGPGHLHVVLDGPCNIMEGNLFLPTLVELSVVSDSCQITRPLLGFDPRISNIH